MNKNCINSNQYSLKELYYLCSLADNIKQISLTKSGASFLSKLLNNKRAILYFNQPSTRTFLSFQNACYILGIKCSEIRDTNTSSFSKGESELDSITTFSQYVDLLIMRHTSKELIKTVDKKLDNLKIINAGSGTDQHPTQALLDFYTIHKYGIENKKVGFVGDLKRGRTVRSLALLLNHVKSVKLYFIAPPEYQIEKDILNQLDIKYEVIYDFDQIIGELDVIYMTRIQKEYGGIDKVIDEEKFVINKEKLSMINKNAIIMHPLPRVYEITEDVDLDSRAKYFEQVANGMWMRTALIAKMFDVDKKIINKLKVVKQGIN